jgi:hypothetical protein
MEASEASLLAEVLLPLAAEEALATSGMQPRDADAVSKLCPFSYFWTDGINDADPLMAGRDWQVWGMDVAFDDVQVGVANATIAELDANLPDSWFRE